MRILAVGSMYPPHHKGGYELVWQGAMRRARAAGHEVRVVASDYRDPDVSEEDDPDVHRTLESYWSWEDYDFRRLNPLQRLRLERSNAAEFRRQLREFRPDVVTWWQMDGMSLALIEQARRSGLPSVLVVHDDWLVFAQLADRWHRLWIGRPRILARAAEVLTGISTRFRPEAADRVLFNSRFMRRRAEEQGIRLENAAVLSPGIDPRFRQPEPAAEAEWSWRMLCVGRIDRHKGVDTALAALPELPPQATLIIAGSGDESYLADLHAQVERLGVGDRVTFAGFVSGDSLPELFTVADVVVFPVRWEEPWGLVPLEAMGMGRPVVSTGRGGSVEYLRDGANALVFDVDDARSLANCVRRLGADPALRRQLRARGLETAAEHTAEAFEARIVDELELALWQTGARS